MATRFFFRGTTAPDISPAFDAAWEIASVNRRILVRKSLNDLAASLQVAPTVPITTTQDILGGQWVSEPLRAQTISGTFSLITKMTESDANCECTLAVNLRVCSKDGATFRGTLYSVFGTDTEFGTTAATRIINAASLTPLAIQDGDRLVLEVGARATAPLATGTFTLAYNTSATSDFALTSNLTTSLRTWCEFSQDLFPRLPNNYQSAASQNGISVSERVR